MSESAFFRQDKKALAFRAWLAELGGSVIDLPSGAFKESGTGVKTRIIIVDKPDGEISPASGSDQIQTGAEVDLGVVVGEVMDFISQLMDAQTEEELPTLETIANALPTTVIISSDAESEEAAPPLPQTPQERGTQKALEGFGSNDKLLKLRQSSLF